MRHIPHWRYDLFLCPLFSLSEEKQILLKVMCVCVNVLLRCKCCTVYRFIQDVLISTTLSWFGNVLKVRPEKRGLKLER